MFTAMIFLATMSSADEHAMAPLGLSPPTALRPFDLGFESVAIQRRLFISNVTDTDLTVLQRRITEVSGFEDLTDEDHELIKRGFGVDFADLSVEQRRIFWEDIGKAFKDAGDWIVGAVEDGADWVVGAVNDAGDWLEGAAEDVAYWTVNAVGDVGDWCVEAVNDIGDWTEEAYYDAGEWLENAAEDTLEGATVFFEGVGDFVVETWNNLEDAVVNFGECLSRTFVDGGCPDEPTQASALATDYCFVRFGDAFIDGFGAGCNIPALEASVQFGDASGKNVDTAAITLALGSSLQASQDILKKDWKKAANGKLKEHLAVGAGLTFGFVDAMQMEYRMEGSGPKFDFTVPGLELDFESELVFHASKKSDPCANRKDECRIVLNKGKETVFNKAFAAGPVPVHIVIEAEVYIQGVPKFDGKAEVKYSMGLSKPVEVMRPIVLALHDPEAAGRSIHSALDFNRIVNQLTSQLEVTVTGEMEANASVEVCLGLVLSLHVNGMGTDLDIPICIEAKFELKGNASPSSGQIEADAVLTLSGLEFGIALELPNPGEVIDSACAFAGGDMAPAGMAANLIRQHTGFCVPLYDCTRALVEDACEGVADAAMKLDLTVVDETITITEELELMRKSVSLDTGMLTSGGHSSTTSGGHSSVTGVVYKGCYENKGAARKNGHENGVTYDECLSKARAHGKSLFGMEYPQGSSRTGEAQCLLLDSAEQYLKMRKKDDGDCQVEVYQGKRLGGAYRLAVYELNADGWSMYENFCVSATNQDLIQTNTPSGDASVHACKQVCTQNAACTGIEWYAGGWDGSKCKLIKEARRAAKGAPGSRWQDALCYVRPIDQVSAPWQSWVSGTGTLGTYVGCGKNEGSARVNGHESHLTYDQCREKAISMGKVLFGLEYPQGSDTKGQAQCLILNSEDQFHLMGRAYDSECAAEGLHNGRRLGSSYRIAVYSLVPVQTPLPDPRQTYTVHVGKNHCHGSGIVKTVEVPHHVICPSLVSKSNWKGTATYPDMFAVMVSQSNNGNSVTVTRLDAKAGWCMDLQFECFIVPTYTVDIGSSSMVSKSVTLPVSGLDCEREVDKSNWLGGYWHNDRFEISVAGNTVTAKRMPQGSPLNGYGWFNPYNGWSVPLKFKCSMPKYTVIIDSNPGSTEKSMDVPHSHLICPSLVSKLNWLGGYTYGDLFVVSVSGSTVTAKRVDAAVGWNMPLQFDCYFSPTYTVEMGSSGSGSKSVTVPMSGLQCESTVHRENWLGGYQYADTFAITVSGKTIKAQRTDQNRAWSMNLKFYCYWPTYTVTIGNSGNPTKEVSVPHRNLACPSAVHRHNWLGGHVKQNIYIITTTSSTVSAERVDEVSGWSMNLQFPCYLPPTYKVVIGAQTDATVKAVAVPHADLVCPLTVDKTNWIGGNNPGIFKITVEDFEVTAWRVDIPEPWNTNLKFDCYHKSL